MRPSHDFLLGLLDHGANAYVAQEDLGGQHGDTIRLWQRMGFIDREPGVNPVAGCPHCGEGVPYRIGEVLLCNRCRSRIDPASQLLWRLDPGALLGWVAAQWHLTGGVRRLDSALWQLGTLTSPQGVFEFFYRGAGALTEEGRGRLLAFRQAVLISGRALPHAENQDAHLRFTLLDLLRTGEALTLAEPAEFLRPGRGVRFDAATGTLWAGAELLGEVPPGSRECFFLACLAGNLDRFVPYADLKREVQCRSGTRDGRDEATYCHRLKSSIKRRFIPATDSLVVTNNKGEGYRLRGWVEAA